MDKSQITEMPFFYDRYINLIIDGVDVLEVLKTTQNNLEELKDDFIRNKNYQYQAVKWTPKDILQHLIDTERIMSYRALVLARGEQQDLIGFEEDKYAQNTNVSNRTVEDLLEEFKLVRSATIHQFKHFTKEMFVKTGECSGIHVTPLIFGFICVGHVKHHISVLKEKYFIN
ncbi:hypothetical protein FHR24_002773 [Wenyingzhuangia heitensis]|uniref:DinB-like domain-containing protein n=1 Tax=Wenyingzhuangia heitensis TaxID=1487859 RepID=A0ABX0UBT5_9FLAO|nr:DinB family protein [Wenyingzhuangia heitensis]NIJ46289.1 hypothetical protein [Wenyingzhuangia heitensis]